MSKRVITLLLVLSFGVPSLAEIAVIPYKIDAPSKDFPVSLGGEYARALAAATVIMLDMEVHSPRDIEMDLEKWKLDPQGAISREELDSLGKSRYVDAFLVGTLYKSRGEYIAESILYSVRSRNITSRTRVRARSLPELAEKEVRAVFPGKERSRGSSPAGKIDITFVMDLSYGVKSDWARIKKGVRALSSEISADWRGGTRVNLVPFSTAHTIHPAGVGLKSALALSRALGDIAPKGGNNEKTVEKALADAVSNVPWRSDARKIMVVVSGTPFPRGTRLQHYAHFAKRKGITVWTVALGDVSGEGREYLRELSVIGGGLHADAAYHQKLFDAKGDEINVYLEGGRLFTSTVYDKRWRSGLYEEARRGSTRARSRDFLRELFYDDGKLSLRPATLEKIYTELTAKRLINTSDVSGNVSDVLLSLAGKHFAWTGKGAPRSLGRALVYQDRTSLWIDINTEKDLSFFLDREKTGTVFPLGVVVKKKRDYPYGMMFDPRFYVTKLTADYIPSMLKADLDTIIGKSGYYSGNGMLNPPVWFLELKVEQVKYKKGGDVRDE